MRLIVNKMAVIAVAATVLSGTASAQFDLGGALLKGVMDAAQQRQVPNSQNIPLPEGILPPSQDSKEPAGPWPSRIELLEAAKNGTFNGLPNLHGGIHGADIESFNLSIKSILQGEYGVPRFPDWPGTCRREFMATVFRLFRSVTEANLNVLGNQPPEFINTQARDRSEEIRKAIQELQRTGDSCDSRILGQWKAHPYKEATPKLLGEYGQAISQWVVAERERRKTAYAENQSRIQAEQRAREEAQAKRNAEQRAAEQKRIDAERMRIEADQKRRQQKEKSRIAG